MSLPKALYLCQMGRSEHWELEAHLVVVMEEEAHLVVVMEEDHLLVHREALG